MSRGLGDVYKRQMMAPPSSTDGTLTDEVPAIPDSTPSTAMPAPPFPDSPPSTAMPAPPTLDSATPAAMPAPPAPAAVASTDGDADPDANFVDELDQLIQAGGPDLVYPPIGHGLSGTVIGYEALARFAGRRPTGRWFQLAHEAGRGADLELTILRQVVDRLDESDGKSYLACNLSPTIIGDARLNQIASMHRSDRLVIELTGRDTASELRMLKRELEALRDDRKRVGVHLSSLDQTTLSCLVMEQPDMVKLDVELTRRLASGEESIAPEFLRRCRHEGIFVVAVGVETDDDLHAVEAIGADAYQGFLIDDRT